MRAQARGKSLSQFQFELLSQMKSSSNVSAFRVRPAQASSAMTSVDELSSVLARVALADVRAPLHNNIDRCSLPPKRCHTIHSLSVSPVILSLSWRARAAQFQLL